MEWAALIVAVHYRRAATAEQLVRLGADVTVADEARSDPAAVRRLTGYWLWQRRRSALSMAVAANDSATASALVRATVRGVGTAALVCRLFDALPNDRARKKNGAKRSCRP